MRYSVLAVAVILAAAGVASAQNISWVAPNTYTQTHNVNSNTWVAITGSGTATYNGLWTANSSAKTLWKANGANLYIGADTEIQNNWMTSGKWLYASNVQWEGNPLNTGANNEVFECAPGFSADLGSGVIGSITPTNPQPSVNTLAGGLTTLRVHNARMVTHASQNLPTAWKHSDDKSSWFASGQTHHSHHGLLIFADIMNYDGTSSGTAATSSEWHVKTNDQTYDGGLYWQTNWTLNVDQGVKLTSNTHFEQAAIGVHVGFGVQGSVDNTTMTKTGEGALVIARGGIQGYRTNTTMDIQQGRVEFNSNEATNSPSYYQASNGQVLKLKVAAGAEVDFHAYTYPISRNHYTNSNYSSADNLHQVASIESNGKVKIGGLWSASTCAWDQAYETTLNNIKAETALARQAKLDVLGNMTLGSTSVLEVVLGAASASDNYQAIIRGTFAQAGTLKIIDDGTLTDGIYDLFDGTLTGMFSSLLLPPLFEGTYNQTTGVLSLVVIPEPVTMAMLAFGAVALLRRRR